VLGAVSVATAAILPGSVVAEIAVVPPGKRKAMSVEHPSGEFSVGLELADANAVKIVRVGLLRTARALSKGELYVPAAVYGG
jgi:4-oxalomesaconate tautomerase